MPQSPKSSTSFEEFLSNIPTMENYLDDTNKFSKEQNLDFDIEVFKGLYLYKLKLLLSDDFERQWNLTGNPLFVLGGLRFCKDHKLTTPQWILEYLYLCAENLTLMEPESSDRAAHEVYSLLGLNFGGSGTFFSKFQDHFLHYKAYFKIIRYRMDNPSASRASAIRAIGKEIHKSPETVKKWFKAIEESWDYPKRTLPKGYKPPN